MNTLFFSRLRCVLVVRHVWVAIFFVGLLSHSSVVLAKPEQESDEAMKAAHGRLTKLLDETDDLFYKTKTSKNGQPFYTVIWESEGETSKIILGLKELGHYHGQYFYAINAWAYVATSEEPMPPAVIKAISTANDTLLVGNFSCSQNFKEVYANMSGILGDSTSTSGSGSIWMYCAYLHSNRLKMKGLVDQAMAGAGR